MGDVVVSPQLASWLTETLNDPGPFRARQLAGGNSNETLLIASERGSAILRRPPASSLDPTAHNMSREYRVLSALMPTDVPAPDALGLCTDTTVWPTPMLLLEHVVGVTVGEEVPDELGGPAATAEVGHAAIDALVALHSVDWNGLGLADYGKPQDYLKRQVGRWRSQYERHAVRQLDLFEPLASWLEEHRPSDEAPVLLHGDFHTDNCLFVGGAEVRVSAILDWELSTVGDPLVDLGLFLAFWGTERSAEPGMPQVQRFSRVANVPTRAQLAERYAAATGRDVSDLDWYMTLALWKLAAIVEGAYAKFMAGTADSDYARRLGEDVPRLLADAAQYARL